MKKWQKAKFDFATFLNYNAVYEYERRENLYPLLFRLYALTNTLGI